MRLSHALLRAGMDSNALFPTPDGPMGSIEDVLVAILAELRLHLANPNFADELESGETLGGEQAWLNEVFTRHGGYLPPYFIGRLPHKTGGKINEDIRELHAYVSRPLKLEDSLKIRLSNYEDPDVAQWLIKQDPYSHPYLDFPWVAASLWDKHAQHSAFPSMLVMDVADHIDKVLHLIDPDKYALSGNRTSKSEIDTRALQALREWHLSLTLANEDKIGLSSITARLLALPSMNSMRGHGMGHNSLNFAARHFSWKRDFQIYAPGRRCKPGPRQAKPVGGFKRLNERRVSQLTYVARITKGIPLVDKPLRFPRNVEYGTAAKVYADHLDAEVWTGKSSPDADLRPIRPLYWPNVTEADKVPMATCGTAFISLASNLLETVIILEEPAAIITERWAIVSGEIPASIASTLQGRPVTDIIEHPLLDPIGEPGDPDYEATTLRIKQVGTLFKESAGNLYRKLDVEEAAWQALNQAINFSGREMPEFMKALKVKTPNLLSTPVPGCTLITFERRPIIGNTPLGTVELSVRQIESLNIALEFKDFLK